MNIQESLDFTRKGLVEYFKRTFAYGRSLEGVDDPSKFAPKMDAFLDEDGRFIKTPYVERQIPYAESTRSLGQLAGENKIDKDVANAFARYLAGTKVGANGIHLYTHQEEALDVVSNGGNLVVCTGTGSGKTESFLLPIINSIVQERKEARDNGHSYESGVRAMILYPMNALVNDQIRRLRSVIRELPENIRPTYGLYTGELPTTEDHPDIGRAKSNLCGKDGKDKPELCNTNSGDSFASDDIPLPCEYRHRWEWMDKNNGGRGPADILVTNYSMLERLLLLPETSPIFSYTWKFIVIDEAHSYTGSMGTEIAWLIRRVEKRVNGQDRLQFIATSATLRKDKNEADNEKWIAENFASKLFPAAAETFKVKFGKKREICAESATTAEQCDISALAKSKLAERTFELLEEEKTNKDKEKLLPQIDRVRNDGKVAADSLFGIICGMPGLESSTPVVSASGNIRKMIQLALDVFGQNESNWKDYLHDPIDPRPGRKTTAKGKPVYQGNRLEVLDNWKKVLKQESDSLTAEEFRYLYIYSRIAADECESESAGQGTTDGEFLGALDIASYAVEPTQEFKISLRVFADEVIAEHRRIEQSRREIADDWCRKAGVEGFDVENAICALLQGQDAVGNLQKCNFEQIRPITEFADEVFGKHDADSIDAIYAIFRLGMVARKKGDRMPLFDIRYHVMARGLSNVALSFPDGKLGNLTISQTAEPNDENGNIRFALGACRKCGHPFILAYSDVERLTLGDEYQLVREWTPRYRYIHALAWVRGTEKSAGEFDDEQEEQDGTQKKEKIRGKEKSTVEHPVLYVNLANGRCTTNPCVTKEHEGWTPMAWVRNYEGKEEKATKHIDKCPNCGAKDYNPDAEYGVITPFEGEGQQVKIEALQYFAVSSETDTNPRVKEIPGNGRKVLAFSDSRSRAAKLALDFDETYRRRFFVKLVADQMKTPILKEDEEQKSKYDNLKKELKDAEDKRDRWKEQHFSNGEWDFPKSEGRYEAYSDDVEEAKLKMEEAEPHPLTLPNTIANIAEQIADIPELAYYLQILDNDPHSKEPQLLTTVEAAKSCILEALRDPARNSLLKAGIVTIKSTAIEKAAQDESLAIDGIGGLDQSQCDKFNKDIVRLYRDVYLHIFMNGKICLPEGWRDVDAHSKWKVKYSLKPPKRQEQGEDNGIRHFCSSRKLKGLLDDYVHMILGDDCQLNNKTKDAILQSVFEALRGSIGVLKPEVDGGDAYCLSAQQLLDDLVLEPGRNIGAVDSVKAPSLRIEEHTAQISAEQGKAYQSAFANGKVNLLSCSTTFEMGIDLGALNRVFLANMPPATANYRQRAGRAGRRAGAMPLILSFAGDSDHDRYYYDNPEKLFDGEIVTPHIYLEKPTFRARHLRAEMLHAFLVWWNGQNNGKGKWKKLNDFFTGYTFHKVPDGGDYDMIPVDGKCGRSVATMIGDWLNCGEEDGKRSEAVLISDVPKDENLHIIVAKDLAFQLTGAEVFQPYDFTTENRIRYLELLGPCIPVENDGRLEMPEDPRRRCASDRVFAKLGQYRANWTKDGYDDASRPDPRYVKGNDFFVNHRQRSFLDGETIKYLSSYNVLPKYGFPVDVIEMLPPPDTAGSNGKVELQRDLQIGLFEYAPGQIVTADKRSFMSTGYFSGHVDDPGNWYECPSCHRLCTRTGPCQHCSSWEIDDANEVRKNRFVRPEAFVSSLARSSQFSQRGQEYKTYAGLIAEGSESQVNGVNIFVAESDTQMMRFLNAGPDSAGFKVDVSGQLHRLVSNGEKAKSERDPELLVHDIITNIVILTIPDSCLPNGFNSQRTRNAALSAMAAIRAETALLFQVESRDIGALLHEDHLSPSHRGKYSIIIYDNASGGGGLVLPLLKKEDSPIPEILGNALKRCRECKECGKGIDDAMQSLKPVDEAEYRNAVQENGGHIPGEMRLRAACPKCLKQRDNAREAHLLDRFDAARVIENLLDSKLGIKVSDTEPILTQERQWSWIPFTGKLRVNQWYKLKDGTEIQYKKDSAINKSDIESEKGE